MAVSSSSDRQHPDPFAGFVETLEGDLIRPVSPEVPWRDQEIGLGVRRCPVVADESEQAPGRPVRDQIIVWLRERGHKLADIGRHFGMSESAVCKIVAKARQP
jgi:hypothetical protein